jgi:putative ABC transport system ATP-binding protein
MRLRCDNLTVEYCGHGCNVRPIDGLDLDVESGELALLLGASGCGKTTLLSALAAILRPTRGRITLDGTDVSGLQRGAITEYRRRQVGIVFQSFNLVPSLTAAENVQVPLRAAGVRGRAARRRADELLSRVGLESRRSHRPAQLSGGERQRVAIARSLALDPPLVLADEPTAHLDPGRVSDVVQLFRDIADEGRIVIVATHDERMVEWASRVVRLGAGVVASTDVLDRSAAGLRGVQGLGDRGTNPQRPLNPRSPLHASQASSPSPGRQGFYPDRAAGRDSDHRHPCRDRHPLVPEPAEQG